jgi:surfeit locus 1 family protein
MFSKKWFLTTILVLAAGGVMIRLGFWQLDRLETRRVFNANALAQQTAEVLDLNAAAPGMDLETMAYRPVRAVGTFDFSEEISLRNQVFEGRPAYRLITPLKLTGLETVILVDRGAVPSDRYTPGDRETYAQPSGVVTVDGILRSSQTEPDIGSRSDPAVPPGEELLAWNLVNIAQIAGQVSDPLLPVYIQQAPGADGGGFPVPSTFIPELTEGPHLGYAIQWFLFAGILWLGYPFYFLKETRGARSS